VEKPKRTRKPKAIFTPEAPAPSATPAPTPAPDAGFTIYVDCYPTKGAAPPVLFDDWFRDLEREMAAVALEEEGAKHYMLLDFAKQKALLAVKLEERLAAGVPAALVINSASFAARDALPILTPYASAIVRAMR
jgi:hypothetical protein